MYLLFLSSHRWCPRKIDYQRGITRGIAHASHGCGIESKIFHAAAAAARILSRQGESRAGEWSLPRDMREISREARAKATFSRASQDTSLQSAATRAASLSSPHRRVLPVQLFTRLRDYVKMVGPHATARMPAAFLGLLPTGDHCLSGRIMHEHDEIYAEYAGRSHTQHRSSE